MPLFASNFYVLLAEFLGCQTNNGNLAKNQTLQSNAQTFVGVGFCFFQTMITSCSCLVSYSDITEIIVY
jgi:hypothetical protein